MLQAVPNLSSWAATSARLRAEHRGIVRAIEAGNDKDAAARVHAHVAGYHAESRTAAVAAPALAVHGSGRDEAAAP